MPVELRVLHERHNAPFAPGLKARFRATQNPEEPAFAAAMDCLAAISCEDYIARMSNELAVCEDVVPSYYDLCPGVFLAP